MSDPRGSWTGLGNFLAGIRSSLPRTPSAIPVITAHDAHPQGWTHLAVAIAERNSHEVEAFLQIENRVIEDSYVSTIAD